MSEDSRSRLIVVGVISGAHGVCGDVRVKSFTAAPTACFTYGSLMDDKGNTLFEPKSVRAGKDHFIIVPKIAKQKEEWDALKGTLLHVPRAVLPDTDPDEYYVTDLVGLDVYSGGEARIGSVRSVQDHGAGDIIEIRLDGDGESVLIPFTEADVPNVDIEAGRIIIVTLDLWTSSDEDDADD